MPNAEIAANQKDVRLAIGLLAATLAYNLLEGVIAIWAGIRAGSAALVGFGFDSSIEVAASTVVLWHFLKSLAGASQCELEAREQAVHRFVGFTFLALALYILYKAGTDLWFRNPPEESVIGIILAALSLVVMPVLATQKHKVAKRLQSDALALEAKETMCCFYLSLILLIGLSANALFGFWWADPAGALLMLPWLIREGIEGVKGEPCCGD